MFSNITDSEGTEGRGNKWNMEFKVSGATQKLIDMILANTEIRNAFITFFDKHESDSLLPALKEQIHQPYSSNINKEIVFFSEENQRKGEKRRSDANTVYENNVNSNPFNDGTREPESID